MILQQLSTYLKTQEKLEPLFIEHRRLGYLKIPSRIRLVNALAQLIVNEYAGNANGVEIMSICCATIENFESLEGEDVELNKTVSDCHYLIVNSNLKLYCFQDLLYNPKLRRGFLFDKLRNMGRSKQSRQRKSKQSKSGNLNSLNFSVDLPECDENELLSFLKTYVIKNGTDALKEKLLQTIETRRNWLQTNVIQIKTMFPFYFVDARVVSMHIFYFECTENNFMIFQVLYALISCTVNPILMRYSVKNGQKFVLDPTNCSKKVLNVATIACLTYISLISFIC